MAELTDAQKQDAIVRTILGEAANQGPNGMAAVASVIANRANSGQFGTTDPYRIALQPNQFSANNPIGRGGNNVGRNASVNSPEYQQALAAYQGVMNGTIPDPTGGATYYHTADTTAPWDRNMAQTAQIGAHVFYSPSGHPVPPANIPNNGLAALPTGIDTSAYANGAGSGNSALNAISNISGAPDQRSSPGLAPIGGTPDANTVAGHDFAALGMAPSYPDAANAADMAAQKMRLSAALTQAGVTPAPQILPNSSGSPNDRMTGVQQTMQNLGEPMTAQGAGDFYSSFPLQAAPAASTGVASTNAPGQVGQAPGLSAAYFNAPVTGIGGGTASASAGASGGGLAALGGAEPSTFPGRPGVVAPNGSAPYTAGYGAPANPVTVKPYTPSQSVADINLNDALYPNGQPTYQSTGGMSEIPQWAMPSVPVSVSTPAPGSSSTVVNGAINGAIRKAAPDIASALGPVFGGARSLVDNLPPMSSQTYAQPPHSPTPTQAYLSPSNYDSIGTQAQSQHFSFPTPALQDQVDSYGQHSGSSGSTTNTGYSGSGWDIGGPHTGTSSMAMNDPSGSGSPFSEPRTITQQIVNPAWNQWQAQNASGDAQFSGTDTGLSWAGLNTGDPNDPFSSFASPANIPTRTPAPAHYITKTVPNPKYAPFPQAISDNPVERWWDSTPIGQGFPNSPLRGLAGLSLGHTSTPTQLQALGASLTAQQKAASDPNLLTALSQGHGGYTPDGSNTLMPTTTISGGFRQSYGDAASSVPLSTTYSSGGNPSGPQITSTTPWYGPGGVLMGVGALK